MHWLLSIALVALLAGCTAPATQPSTVTATSTAFLEREVPVVQVVEVERPNFAPSLTLQVDDGLVAPATAVVQAQAVDADGDAFVVEFDLDGDGSIEWRGASPANVAFDLPRPGVRRLVATASDGHDMTRAELMLDVAAPAPFEATGRYDAGLDAQACGAPPAKSLDSALQTAWRLEVPVALRNGTFSATFDFEDNRTFRASTVEFLAGDEVVERQAGNLTIRGRVPSGTDAMRFSSCGGLKVTVRVTLQPWWADGAALSQES